ncbi:endolytic transglycosylase MltG [Cellulomonas chitinilytica]|uniref:endolytic transglycosylase MltG n=1 Tax=Cellulomonas chitinilytica TaxID=398759 RepID=UPI001EF21D31|nr:endolytic transglycosylase MltG [Cellulomonas chitinilytica]
MTDLFGDPAARSSSPESRRSRSRGRARAQRERQKRRRRSIWVLIVALVLVAGAGYVVSELLGGVFGGGSGNEAGVEDYPGPGHPAARVVVADGDTGAMIAHTLQVAGVVATEKAFNRAYAANPDSISIQPGTYNLLLEMKASDAVLALLNPSSRATIGVTIPEGYTTEQTLAKVNEVTLIPIEDLKAAAADPAAIGLPAEAGGAVEGWLFPATYPVEPGASAASVLQQMTAKTVEVLTVKGVPNDQWETVLNKASIVEREAKLAADRPKVARAIDNRLDKQMPLQVDATVAYGLGISGKQLTTEMTQDPSNPYNTYRHLGLPPTPIASPGEVSIDAVLNPEPGDWLFWVTVNLDTGETLFASNYDDHQLNVEKLHEWQAEHGG